MPEPIVSPSPRWIVAGSVMFGTLVVVLNSTGINIAFPQMMKDLQASPDQIQWVMTAYLLAMAVAMPTLGRLTDLLGYRRLFLVCLFIFIISSLFCALAWNLASLVFFRVFQGMGAGLIMTLSMAFLFQVYPDHQRGAAMGAFGIGVSFGPVVGPVIAGYLTDYLNWRAVFYFNLPLGLISMVSAVRFIPEIGERRPSPMDYRGLVTLSIFLTAFLLALSRGTQEGWGSVIILALFLGAALSLVLFLWVETSVKEPLVDLDLYRNLNFSIGSLIGVFFGLSLLSSIFLVSLFVQDLLGYTPREAGLLMAPGALVMGVGMLFSGRLADRWDPRFLLVGGLILLVASSYWLTFLDLRASAGLVVAMMVFRNLGLAIAWSPLMTISLTALSRERVGMGTGLLNIVRQGIGGSMGVALAASILVSRHRFHLLDQMKGLRTWNWEGKAADIFHSLQNGTNGAKPSDLHSLVSAQGEAILKNTAAIAYHDCFLVITCISLLAIVPALFLKKGQG